MTQPRTGSVNTTTEYDPRILGSVCPPFFLFCFVFKEKINGGYKPSTDSHPLTLKLKPKVAVHICPTADTQNAVVLYSCRYSEMFWGVLFSLLSPSRSLPVSLKRASFRLVSAYLKVTNHVAALRSLQLRFS